MASKRKNVQLLLSSKSIFQYKFYMYISNVLKVHMKNERRYKAYTLNSIYGLYMNVFVFW